MIVPAAYSRFDRNADRRGAAGLRLCLRSVTAAAHNRLDARFRSLDLTGVAGYRQFLEANAAALLPLEAALVHARVGRIVPDWAARSRQAAILDDLARTGGKMEPLPLPDPLDFGGVLGTMYVLESSRLGATALLNLVQRPRTSRLCFAQRPICVMAPAMTSGKASSQPSKAIRQRCTNPAPSTARSVPSRCSNRLPRVRFGPPRRPRPPDGPLTARQGHVQGDFCNSHKHLTDN